MTPAAFLPRRGATTARMITPRRACLLAPLALLCGATPARAQPGVITGTAAYRERIALPPGAVLEVDLHDISRADAPVLASTRVAAAGQVPIAFTLRYDPARIGVHGAPAVAARLSVDGTVRWRSAGMQRLPTGGAGGTLDILLVAESPPARAALEGATWHVREIAGQPLAGPQRAEVTFDAQGRAYGTGGCNRFTGGVTVSGSSLRFGPMAQTNMACEDAAMAQEARFHAALAMVRAWRIEAGVLALLDEAGAVAMRLVRAL
jgi:putative lipoprotein